MIQAGRSRLIRALDFRSTSAIILVDEAQHVVNVGGLRDDGRCPEGASLFCSVNTPPNTTMDGIAASPRGLLLNPALRARVDLWHVQISEDDGGRLALQDLDRIEWQGPGALRHQGQVNVDVASRGLAAIHGFGPEMTWRDKSTKLSAERVREWARAGADAALKQLRAEIIAIERRLPKLALPKTSNAARRSRPACAGPFLSCTLSHRPLNLSPRDGFALT